MLHRSAPVAPCQHAAPPPHTPLEKNRNTLLLSLTLSYLTRRWRAGRSAAASAHRDTAHNRRLLVRLLIAVLLRLLQPRHKWLRRLPYRLAQLPLAALIEPFDDDLLLE